MGKKPKKNRQKPNKPEVNRKAILLHRVSIFEDAILYLMLAAVLLVFTTQINSHFTLPKLFLFVILTGLLQLPLLVRIKLGEVNQVPGYLWFGIFGLSVWWLISSAHAVNVPISLIGQYGRYNGLYTSLALMCLFVTLIKIPFNKDRLIRFVWAFVLAMCIVVAYEIIQFAGMDPIFPLSVKQRPISSIGNPVTLAAVILMLVPLLLLMVKNITSLGARVLGINFILLLLFAVLITGSRGPWLAFLAITFSTFIYFSWMNRSFIRLFNIKNLIIYPLLIVVLALFLVYGPVSDRLSHGFGFLVRIFYFEVAFQMILDTPFFGYGFESFRLMYPEYRPIDDIVFYKDVTPTMVHNDYLQLAVDSGLPALGFYLSLILGVIFLFLKTITKNREKSFFPAAGLIMLLGYLVYGMSGWPEIASLVIFWLTLGVFVGSMLRSEPKNISSKYVNQIAGVTLGLHLLFGALCLSYGYILSQKLITDYWLRKAQSVAHYSFSTAEKYINDIVRVSGDDHYYLDQAGLLYMKRLTRQRDARYYHTAKQFFVRSAELNPYDTYAQIHIVENDTIALLRKITNKLSSEAEKAMRQMQVMDPNNYSVYRVRAKAYFAMGDKRRAAIEVRKMNRLLKLREIERPKLLGTKS